jgi:hypothetical protein
MCRNLSARFLPRLVPDDVIESAEIGKGNGN